MAQIVSIGMERLVGHNVVGFVCVGVVRMAAHNGFDTEIAHPMTAYGVAHEAAAGRARGMLFESILERVFSTSRVDSAILRLVYELVNGDEITLLMIMLLIMLLILLTLLGHSWHTLCRGNLTPLGLEGLADTEVLKAFGSFR